MPKYSFPKRRYTRSRRYNRKGASLNPRQKKEVKMIINKNTELKSYDAGYAGAAVASLAGSITPLFPIPQGAGNSQRVGNDITASYMQLQWQGTIATTDASNIIRILIFQWSLDNATAVPTVADILYTGGGMAAWNALPHFDNRDKYKILYDQSVFLEAGSVGSSTASVGPRKLKIPHKTMLFNGGGVTTGRYMTYALLCSDSAAVDHPDFQIQARLVYRDA